MPERGILRAYCEWIRPLTHVPVPFHLAAILPGLAYDVGRRGFTIPYFHRAVVWCGLIGVSGTGKSYATNKATDFVRDWQQLTLGPHYMDPYIEAEGSLPGIVENLSKRFYPPGGVTPAVLSHNEFSKVLGPPDAPEALCLLYDGRDYVRNLRYLQKKQDKGEAVSPIVRAPVVSAVFASTRISMERVFSPSMIEGGLFSRILWFSEHINKERLRFLPEEDRAGRDQLLEMWCQWSGHMDAAHVQGVPTDIVIDPAGLEFIKEELFDAIRARLVTDDRISTTVSRAVPHAVRVATLFALSRGNIVKGRFTVDLTDVVPAVNLVHWCLRHAELLAATLAVDPIVRLQHKVQGFIEQAGAAGISRSDIYRKFNLTKKEVDPVVQALLEQESIVEVRGQRQGPGRPRISYFGSAVFRSGPEDDSEAAGAPTIN